MPSQCIIDYATIGSLLAAFIFAGIEFRQSKNELNRKNNLEFLQARRKLRDTLIELMNYPKNYWEYYNLRRVIKPIYKFDDSQPLLPDNAHIPNSGFYHTIADDLRDLASDVKIWFPKLEIQYAEFISSVEASILGQTAMERSHKATISFDKFDKIIKQMNTIMSLSIR